MHYLIAMCWIIAVFALADVRLSSALGDTNADPDNTKLTIETLRFFDWEVAVSSKEEAKKSCHLQMTGVSAHRIFLSMRLSVVKESPAASDQNALTIIKITAAQIRKEDLSDAVSIELTDAWLETSTVTTLGEVKKIDTGSDPHFLGGVKGTGLFNTLLRGMRKDGLMIGYRSTPMRRAKIFQVQGPPPELFEQLRSCLAKSAAIF